MSAPAKEKTYRWYRRGTHKVADEKRKVYLAHNPEKRFSTQRVCQFADAFGNIELRSVRLSLSAVNGPEATRRFNEMVADQAHSAQAEAGRIKARKDAAAGLKKSLRRAAA